jgi:serine/threonine-protein kinase
MAAPSSIAHYRITSKLGQGGMGEVWRATDTKLDREVAIKILPATLANDAQYIARFEREAQILATLNHPNIAAVYGVEQGAMVMELVEGETLPCPVPLSTALDYARQIADGIEAAHEKGIIHRDLKPANIRITSAGRVKILDFGLAKAAADTAPPTSGTNSPTLSLAMTQAGIILGTAAYMAPEQARGKPVDKRADIWAFGVVLYEMLTGRQLFSGETMSDVLAAVLTRDPDLTALPADTPPAVRGLIRLCLRKDPLKRLRDIAGARLALDEDVATVPVVSPPPTRRTFIPWAMAAVALVTAAAGLAWWRGTRPAPLRPLIRMDLETPSMPAVGGGMLAISRDGTRIALVVRDKDGSSRIHTRALHQDRVTALPGTEDAHTPFFSPDGQSIGFASGGKLKRVSVEGGGVTTLCDVQSLRGASWADDGSIIFSPSVTAGLWRVSAEGGTPVALTETQGANRTHRWPEVLPGSKAVLFTSMSTALDFDNGTIEAVVVATGERKKIRQGGFAPHYVSLPDGSGRLLFVSKGTLFAAPFNPGTLEPAGDAVPLVENTQHNLAIGAAYAVSSSGALLYLQGGGLTGVLQLVWFGAVGRPEPMHGPLGTYFTLKLSPDGKRVAFSQGAASGFDIWVKDLERDTVSRLSFLPGSNQSPVWTPDGRHIVFRSTAQAANGLYWIRADGSGNPHRLTDGRADEFPYSFSPDGKRLALYLIGEAGSMDVATATLEGDPDRPKLSTPQVFVGTSAAEIAPAFSPDGRWIAYVSTESGRGEVYIRAFGRPGGKWQISNAGGTFPRWSTGGELFYRGPDQRIMAVSYAVRGDSFVPGRPRPWSDVTLVLAGNLLPTWDVASDGKRAVTSLPGHGESLPSSKLVFLMNFTDELQRRTAR